jgi:hypothetical protein
MHIAAGYVSENRTPILGPQDRSVGSIPVNGINAIKRLRWIDSLRLEAISKKISTKQSAALGWAHTARTEVSGG